MKNAFIFKNDKGLYISDGKKIYFPDRKFQDAEVGLVRNISITKDKGTYAFFTGEMVKDVKFRDGEKESIINEKYKWGEKFFENTYLGTEVLFVCSDEGIEVYTSGGFFCKIMGMNMFETIKWDCKGIDASKNIVLSWLKDEESSFERVMASLVKAYSSSAYSGEDVSETISVYDNRVANISLKHCFVRCSDGDEVFVYEKGKRVAVSDALSGEAEAVVYSKKQVISWAKENNVIFSTFGDKQGIVSRRFRYGESFCDLKMFGGYRFSEDSLKDEALKKEVAESVENFDRWIKNIGKHCSGKNIDQVSKIMRELKIFRGY